MKIHIRSGIPSNVKLNLVCDEHPRRADSFVRAPQPLTSGSTTVLDPEGDCRVMHRLVLSVWSGLYETALPDSFLILDENCTVIKRVEHGIRFSSKIEMVRPNVFVIDLLPLSWWRKNGSTVLIVLFVLFIISGVGVFLYYRSRSRKSRHKVTAEGAKISKKLQDDIEKLPEVRKNLPEVRR